MSQRPPSSGQLAIAGVIGAVIGWVAFVASVFLVADAQGALGLVASPFVALFAGVAAAFLYAAIRAPDWEKRVTLIATGAILTSPAWLWLASEIAQLVG
ncbi:MAG: hypothetical protein AAF805_04250 [Planctomycetota bacterium]